MDIENTNKKFYNQTKLITLYQAHSERQKVFIFLYFFNLYKKNFNK